MDSQVPIFQQTCCIKCLNVHGINDVVLLYPWAGIFMRSLSCFEPKNARDDPGTILPADLAPNSHNQNWSVPRSYAVFTHVHRNFQRRRMAQVLIMICSVALALQMLRNLRLCCLKKLQKGRERVVSSELRWLCYEP
jgi:hypothetical protein